MRFNELKSTSSKTSIFKVIKNNYIYSKMSETHLDKLIQCVEMHPELYDKGDRNYYNKNCRNESWMNVAAELGVGTDEVQRRWKLLRERYVKQMRARERGSKTGTPIGDWNFLEKMQFLKPCVSKRCYVETVVRPDDDETMVSDVNTTNNFEIVDVALNKSEHEESFEGALNAFTNTAQLLQNNLNELQAERTSVEGRFANLIEASLIEMEEDAKDEAMEKIFEIIMDVKRKYKRKKTT